MKKENWLRVVSFKTELLTENIIHRGYRESLSKLLPGLPPFRNRMIIDNDIYIDLNETDRIQEYFSKSLIKRAIWVYKKIENQSKKLIKISKLIMSNIKNTSNREISNKLEEFFKEFQKTIGAIGVPTIIDLTLESQLKDYLKDSDIKDVDEALSTIAIPFKPVETSKEKEDLLKLIIKIKNEKILLNSKKFEFLVDNHYKEYGWVYSTLFLGNLYNKNQIKKEIKSLFKIAEKEEKSLRDERKKQILEAEKLISKIKSIEGRQKTKFLQKAVYYRTARLEWMNKACFIVRPLLEEVAKRLKIRFDDLIYLMSEEIKDSLIKGSVSKIFKEQIKNRHEGYAVISDNQNEYLLVIGKELRKWKNKFSNKEEDEIIKGVVVFKGKVQGKAVIVKDRSEISKVQEGDILVTPLTTPDFIVGMKKAAGIVTDLGGITSHAAVTSREMKTPCIVGTKNATKILKDGDLVELDTDEGVVKILKR